MKDEEEPGYAIRLLRGVSVEKIDRAKRYYKKCILLKDRLVGAILLGDKNEFQEFKDLISKRTELSEKRLQILRSSNKSEPVPGKAGLQW